MSGECQICGDHTLNCECKDNHIEIDSETLLELIFWARRYCDERSTYAPFRFNRLYDYIVQLNPKIKESDEFDSTLKDRGKFWPYAQDGNYDEKTGDFDARRPPGERWKMNTV